MSSRYNSIGSYPLLRAQGGGFWSGSEVQGSVERPPLLPLLALLCPEPYRTVPYSTKTSFSPPSISPFPPPLPRPLPPPTSDKRQPPSPRILPPHR